MFSACIFSFIVFGLGVPTAYAEPPSIVQPPDGAVVPSEFTVKITFSDISFCPHLECEDVPPDQISLWVDGTVIADCFPCTEMEMKQQEVDFTVMLAEGEHKLVASASVQGDIEFSDPVYVKVTTDDAESSASADSGHPDDGCGCSVNKNSAASVIALIVLGLCIERRRREMVAR
jgi:hypothetical protein